LFKYPIYNRKRVAVRDSLPPCRKKGEKQWETSIGL